MDTLMNTFIDTDILPRVIQEHIQAKRWKELSNKDLNWPEPDTIAPALVDVLINLDKADQVLMFRALPKPMAAEVFAYLERDSRDTLLSALTDQETRGLLAELSPDDRAQFLGELPGQVTQRLLNFLSPGDLREVRQLLGYPEESVGRLMTPDYIAVRPEWTIAKALEHIRRRGRDSETVDIIYVHDKTWHLLDALPLKRFILADPQDSVASIMDKSFVSLSAYDDREEAVRLVQRYDRVALPVVDSNGILIGIVTVDDIFDVAEQEATEDFHQAAAVSPLKTNYSQASPWALYRSRIGWLSMLIIVNLMSSGIIENFEDVLASSVAVAFFIPLIIDTGGNTGSQSATLMIRAISTGDVRMNQWFRVFVKEILMGGLIGATLGLMGLGLGWFRGGIELGLVIFITMVIMLMLTNLIGVALPFVLTRLKLDPAIASGPVLTSIADAVGLIVYFTVAQYVLQL